MKAQEIINDARNRVITHINTLVRKIDAYLETGNKNNITDSEEDIFLNFDDCISAPVITVEVDNSYLDMGFCREVQLMSAICTSGNNDFYVYPITSFGEIKAKDITLEDLLVIAKVLEETYDKMVIDIENDVYHIRFEHY